MNRMGKQSARHKPTANGNGVTTTRTKSLSALYEQDETAWLDIMAALCARTEHDELDLPHLSEYLSDMAKRDRRAVYNRLVTLMCHLLKWEFQPDKQTGSWRGTIREQRRKLRLLLDSKTLRNHASDILLEAYAEAREQAADETQLKVTKFPKECAWGIDELLRNELS